MRIHRARLATRVPKKAVAAMATAPPSNAARQLSRGLGGGTPVSVDNVLLGLAVTDGLEELSQHPFSSQSSSPLLRRSLHQWTWDRSTQPNALESQVP